MVHITWSESWIIDQVSYLTLLVFQRGQCFGAVNVLMPSGFLIKIFGIFFRFSWGQNQRLCAARESNVNELDPIPSRSSEARQSGHRSHRILVTHIRVDGSSTIVWTMSDEK